MDSINFKAQPNYNISPEIQKRLESEENFSALDKEKLKQDTAEFATKQVDEVKRENFIFRIMRSFGAKDPKKLLKSLGLTALTVAGIAFIGNMLANPTAKLGIKIDKYLLEGDSFLSKGYRRIADFLSQHKANFVDKLKNSNSKTIRNLYETFTNRKLGPVNAFAKTYPSGGRGIFGMTSPSILNTSLKEKSGLNQIAKELNQFGRKNLGLFQRRGFSNNVIQTFFNEGEEKTVDMLKSFGMTNPEEIITKLKKSDGFISSTLSKLFNDGTASSIRNQMFVHGSYDNITISRQMINGLRGLNPESPTFKSDFVDFVTQDFSKRPDLEAVTNVTMNQGGLVGAWWPVNIIDKAGSKIAKLLGKEWKGFGRGNLFNALMKFNAMDGKMAQTLPGRIAQKSVIFPAEYISNFVNDKSGYGVLLCASLMTMYNNVQDAPKEKRVPTVASDFASTIGGVAITAPVAAAITYGIATLKNLDTNIFTFIPKYIGKVVGLGLKTYKNGAWQQAGLPARFLGGALRLGLIMAVVMPKISKPVNALIHKIFGKPYDKAEEEQKKALEEQQNAIIPELGITNKQLMEKMQANPKALEDLQKNPLLAQQIANEPKLLLDLLDGKEIKPKKIEMSPANKSLLNKLKNNSSDNKIDLGNSANLFSRKETKKQEKSSLDTATYVPSSEYAVENAQSEVQSAEYNSLMARADKALKNAEKYL